VARGLREEARPDSGSRSAAASLCTRQRLLCTARIAFMDVPACRCCNGSCITESRQERLENELSGYKTQLIKESIRVRLSLSRSLLFSVFLYVALMRTDWAQRTRRLPLRARRPEHGAEVLRAHARLLLGLEAHHPNVPQRNKGPPPSPLPVPVCIYVSVTNAEVSV
jgi:hypothetical protein